MISSIAAPCPGRFAARADLRATTGTRTEMPRTKANDPDVKSGDERKSPPGRSPACASRATRSRSSAASRSWLLHAQAPGARHRRHRRRARHEPLDHAPLRDHARRARLPRAGRLAQVPPRPARDRPGDVGARTRPACASTPTRTSRSCASAPPTRSTSACSTARRSCTSTVSQLPPRPEQDRPRPAPRLAPAGVLHRRWASCCSPTCPSPSSASCSRR